MLNDKASFGELKTIIDYDEMMQLNAVLDMQEEMQDDRERADKSNRV